MPKRIALVIRNDSYQDTKLSWLKTPNVDIEAVASVLREPTIGNFHPVETLINQPAQQVRQRIADLFHHKKPYDLLLLYFVGHGLLDEAGQLYLTTSDTASDALEETVIPVDYLASWMDRSFSRQQILVLDCYHAILSASEAEASWSTRIDIASTFKGRGRIVLAATDAIQYILTGDEVRGEAEDFGFSPGFIQGLRTGAADTNEDGQVGIRELYDYLCGQAASRGNIQRPHQWTYREPDDFIIAHNSKKLEWVRPIKWDLIFGAIMTPITIVVIGGGSDLRASIGMAGLFLLLYAFLYWVPE